MNVLILALGGDRMESALVEADFVADHDGTVSIIAGSRPGGVERHPCVAVKDISRREKLHPVNYIEWLFVFRLPRIGAGLFAFSPGGRRLADVVERFSWSVHRTIYKRPYKYYIRPWVLDRIAGSEVISSIDRQMPDQLLIADAMSLPLGLKLARRYPRIRVSLTLDRSAFAESSSSCAA